MPEPLALMVYIAFPEIQKLFVTGWILTTGLGNTVRFTTLLIIAGGQELLTTQRNEVPFAPNPTESTVILEVVTPVYVDPLVRFTHTPPESTCHWCEFPVPLKENTAELPTHAVSLIGCIVIKGGAEINNSAFEDMVMHPLLPVTIVRNK
jgi:hypothetical protein